MTTPYIQTSSVSGELSPSVYGRVDKEQYKNGAATARNGFVNYRGGWTSRAGTQYVGMTKQNAPNLGGVGDGTYPARLINFQYSINQGYILEFGDSYMRIIQNGGYILEQAKAVVNAAQSDPGVLFVIGHGYSVGDWVYIGESGDPLSSDMQGMTEYNGQIWVVKQVLSGDSFSLTDLFGNNVDATAFSAWTSGGTTARIYTVPAPYLAADLSYLKVVQSANTMTLCCVNQGTQVEYPPYDLQRGAPTTPLPGGVWTFTESTFASAIPRPQNVVAEAASSTTLTTWYGYVVTAVSATDGSESRGSVMAAVQNNDINVYAGSNVITWTAVAGAASYNIYSATASYNNPVSVGSPTGFIGTALGTTFTDTNIIPDFTQVPPIHNNPFAPNTVLQITVTDPGLGYIQDSTSVSIASATGAGLDATPVVINNKLAGVVVNYGGENYNPLADTVVISGGGSAKGEIGFPVWVNIAQGDTITLNGTVWEAVEPPSTGVTTFLCMSSQTGLSLGDCLTAFVSALNQSHETQTSQCIYTLILNSTGYNISVVYKTPGTIGNSFTLAINLADGGGAVAPMINGGVAGAAATFTIYPASPIPQASGGTTVGVYPSVAAYYQQRRVYANSLQQPDTYWMSQPGSYLNFDSSIPITDSDAITGTPWAAQINGVQFMIPTINGLLAFTGNGVWLVNGGNSTAITPSDQNALAQAQIGCSALIQPLYINLHVLYVQAKNSIVRDVSYNFLYNVFNGNDITVFANHLFDSYTLLRWAYAEEPYKLIWAIRNDGIMLSLTYLKEQEIIGWARHDTNGLFVDVCNVIEPPLNEDVSFTTEPPTDAIYVIAQRYIVGEGVWVWYVERMNNRLWQNIEDCFCVDAGVWLPLNYPAAVLSAPSATGSSNISGTNVIQGGNYPLLDAVATAVDSTGAGSGATFTVSYSGNAISAVIPVTQGDDYTVGATQIIITSASGGIGAVVQPLITNNVTFTASSSVFVNSPGLGAVGDVLRVDGGKATITEYISGTQVVGNITQPLTLTVPNDPNNLPVPAASGTWSLATPITVLTGLDHLNGMVVTGLADGYVIDPVTVVNGSITLPIAASAINVGLGFTAQWQSLYLDFPGQQGTNQGRRGNIQAVTVRVENSRGIELGSNQPVSATLPNQANVPWTNMTPIKDRNFAVTAGSAQPLFSGDSLPELIPGQWNANKMVAVQQTQPLPVTLTAIIPRYTMGDQSAP